MKRRHVLGITVAALALLSKTGAQATSTSETKPTAAKKTIKNTKRTPRAQPGSELDYDHEVAKSLGADIVTDTYNATAPLDDLPQAFTAATKEIAQRFAAIEGGASMIRDVSHNLDTIQLSRARLASRSVSRDWGDSDRFRYQLVEQMLSQAASLLERALVTRKEYQSLYEKNVNTLCDLFEATTNDRTLQEDVSAGSLVHDWLLAGQNEKASPKRHATGQEQLELMGFNLDRHKPGDQWDSARTSWASTTIQSKYDQQVSGLSFVAQSTRSRYEAKSIAYKRARLQAMRRARGAKAIAYAVNQTAYDFIARMKPLQERFLQDWGFAEDRLPAIRDGLSKIYGFALPAYDDTANFEQSLLAIRSAVEWLIRFGNQEQTYTMTLSLRALLGKQTFEAGVTRQRDAGAWKFNLPNGVFQEQKHVRLRGLSAHVASADGNAQFNAVVRLPHPAITHHLDGSSTKLQQDNVPPIRIGRIHDRRSSREPDVVGTLTTHNASPIGTDGGAWVVIVSNSQMPPLLDDATQIHSRGPAGFEIFPGELEDVLLDLHLAVRAVV